MLKVRFMQFVMPNLKRYESAITFAFIVLIFNCKIRLACGYHRDIVSSILNTLIVRAMVA